LDRIGTGDLDELQVALVQTINALSVSLTRDVLLLHAGVVGDAEGGAAILAGGSGAGKTTLVAELVLGGMDYLSDETAAVEWSPMRVRSCPKPLSLKPLVDRDSGPLSRWAIADRPAVVAAHQLRAGAARPEPAIPALLVFPRYVAGAAMECRPVSRARAAMLAGENTSRLTELGDEVVPALSALVQPCRCFSLTYSDVSEAADVVLGLLAQS
jgi:hypothetical protein